MICLVHKCKQLTLL